MFQVPLLGLFYRIAKEIGDKWNRLVRTSSFWFFYRQSFLKVAIICTRFLIFASFYVLLTQRILPNTTADFSETKRWGNSLLTLKIAQLLVLSA